MFKLRYIFTFMGAFSLCGMENDQALLDVQKIRNEVNQIVDALRAQSDQSCTPRQEIQPFTIDWRREIDRVGYPSSIVHIGRNISTVKLHPDMFNLLQTLKNTTTSKEAKEEAVRTFKSFYKALFDKLLSIAPVFPSHMTSVGDCEKLREYKAQLILAKALESLETPDRLCKLFIDLSKLPEFVNLELDLP